VIEGITVSARSPVIPGLAQHVTQRGNGRARTFFADLIEGEPDLASFGRLRRSDTIGRPVGDEAFIAGLEAQTQRLLRPAKRGPKGRARAELAGEAI